MSVTSTLTTSGSPSPAPILPQSTPLAPTRSGRIRKPITKYGSMVDSDQISDPEDEGGLYVEEEEQESGDWGQEKGASEDEDDDQDMGEDSDDEGTKKRKRAKKANTKRPTEPSKPVQSKMTAMMKIVKATKGESMSKAKAGQKVKEGKAKKPIAIAGKKRKAEAKAVEQEPSEDDEAEEGGNGQKERQDSSETKNEGRLEDDGDEGYTGQADQDKIATNGDQATNNKSPSTSVTPAPSTAPSSKVSSAEPPAKKAKPGVALAPSKVSSSSNKIFAPLKKSNTLELAPTARAKKGVVLAKKGAPEMQNEAKKSKKQVAEDQVEEDKQVEANEGQEEDEDKGKAEDDADEDTEKTRVHSSVSRTASDTSSTGSASGNSTKITAPMRLAIFEGLSSPAFNKKIDFGSMAKSFNQDGLTSAQLSRHWRESLSSDIRAHLTDGTAIKKPDGKGGKAKAIGIDHRVTIWHEVCQAYDKADWDSISQAAGMSATKLKRHLREVLIKEVKKAIGGK